MSQRRIGKYEILGELGRGAMGIVYRAADPFIKRVVAIKSLHVAQTLSPAQTREVQERFLREAQTAGNLDHPNILKIYDVGKNPEDGVPYIVMEYVKGVNLEDVMKRQRIHPNQILHIVEQIVSALDEAHAKGIVHRDIKPANILLKENGDVKIADFGIARIASSELTQDYRYLGTPSYMAPEQIQGRAPDGRADLFSLGVLCYRLLSGRKPFDGENVMSISYKIVHEDPPPLAGTVENLSPEIDLVIGKILAKNPDERYQTGKEFLESFREAMSQPPPVEEDLTVVSGEREKTAPPEEKRGPRLPPLSLTWIGIAAVAVLLVLGWGLLKTFPGSVEKEARKAAGTVSAAPTETARPPGGHPGPVVEGPASQEESQGTEERPAARESPPGGEEESAVPGDPAGGQEREAPSPPAPRVRELEKHEIPGSRSSPALVAGVARLEVKILHWINRGSLTVYVDDNAVKKGWFSKKKYIPAKTSSIGTASVPAGTHRLKVKVVGSKGNVFWSKSERVTFDANTRRKLTVTVGTENLSLRFE